MPAHCSRVGTEAARALVVVESHFGNTVAVADAAAAALRAAGVPTEVRTAHEADTTLPEDLTLLLLAAPTHGGDLSTPATRSRAAGLGAKDSTDSRGLREWLQASTGARAARVVTLGTATPGDVTAGTTSAARAARLAGEVGFADVTEGPACTVRGVAGPLTDGALRDVRAWASGLVV